VNTLEPRKNTERVVRAFTRLVREQRDDDLMLVLVGAEGWLRDGITAALADAGPVRARIIVTGYVSDHDMAPLYSGALGFVYPSLYEGFGLPVLEAMQCGTPVITSNTSSLPEVVAGAATMVAPTDPDGLCQAMHRLATDGALRATLSAKGRERAALFTWDRCTQQVLSGYEVALAHGPAAPQRPRAIALQVAAP
jgi:glycosyltransferase involved in cell wall biosynthesis